MRRFCLLLLVTMTPLIALNAWAIETPSAQQVSERLEAAIPPFWSVSSIKITATANAGDAVDPKIKQRFEATVETDRALFAKDKDAAEMLAPYIPIVPTLGAKQTRVLYGVAQSTYSAGDWRIAINLENGVAGLGKPKSMFSGPTLVRGSERETEVQSILASDLTRKIQQQAESEIRKIEADNKAELRAIESAQAKALSNREAEVEAARRKLNEQEQKLAIGRKSLKADAQKLQVRIQTQQAKSDSRMRELKAAQAKALDELRARYAAQRRAQQQKMADLEEANKHELMMARQSHQDKLDALSVSDKAEIERVKQALAAALSTLQAKQEGTLATLRQENMQQLALAKAGYKKKIQMLQQQIEDSSRLAALQKKKGEEEANLAAIRKQAMEDRAQRSQALLAKFRRNISADDPDVRRSAFAAAMDSENPLLRHVATTLAFASDDEILTTIAFRHGLNTSDETLRSVAVKAGLASDDAGRRTRALVAALNGEDRVMQHQALTEILSNSNAITGIYKYEGDPYPFTLKISEYDSATDTLQGELLGWRSCDDMMGNLAGSEVTMGNHRGCAAHFSLANSSKMKGALIDRGGTRYESQATIGE